MPVSARAADPSRPLDALRQALDTVVERPRAPRDLPTLATGVGALDALLPGGGLPRGRLTELQAPRGQGRTTLLQQVVGAVLAAGRWVAIVDAERTLDPAGWAPVLAQAAARVRAGRGMGAMAGMASVGVGEDAPRLAVIRPRSAQQAAWCADVLLRSGAYALVILDGVPTLARPVVLRLTRLAQDRQACLLIATDTTRGAGALVGASVRLDLALERPAPASRVSATLHRGPLRLHGATETAVASPPAGPSLRIQLAKGGSPQAVRVPYVLTPPIHLDRHPLVPDRRGVARTAGAVLHPRRGRR